MSTLGVPRLRAVFLDVFGHYTASNNGAWLRRKLAEPAEGGRGRAAQIRARDASAAIWTTGRVRGVSKVAAYLCSTLGLFNVAELLQHPCWATDHKLQLPDPARCARQLARSLTQVNQSL